MLVGVGSRVSLADRLSGSPAVSLTSPIPLKLNVLKMHKTTSLH